MQADGQGAFTNLGMGGGWLVAFVESPAEQVWLLDAQGHNSVRVNDVPRCGDIYSNGSVELPVLLQSGTNTLIFSGSRGSISARLRRPEKNIFLSTRDTTFPHVMRGESEPLWGALLLVNATNEVQAGLELTGCRAGLSGDRHDRCHRSCRCPSARLPFASNPMRRPPPTLGKPTTLRSTWSWPGSAR